ncbi:hypothetical protein LQV63_02635 [Paenibacillus profundus]|uniref:Uncharacterized protein n=1 Tax=Paenibacillus profundus TaxID=1173085 RepID=A0ABS8YFD6_9BACL|nr:hypothetical protein [Paenibacillus profundus]MCE5168219.1 hypothetical protein [Paenibacillus profundus]
MNHQFDYRMEKALTEALVTKIEKSIWKPASRNSQGEMVLLPNRGLA